MKNKIILSLALAGTLLVSCNLLTKNEKQTKEKMMDKTNEVRKKPFTSTHIFTATFEDIKFHTCMGRTAGCPDQCGSSGNMATFKVKEYKDFIVNGQGGTEKLTKYSVLISDFYKKDLKTAYVNEIKNLKKGDEVIIHIEYVYNTTKSTVRTIENLIGITKIHLPLKAQMEK